MPVSVDYSSPGMIAALMAAGLKVVDGAAWIDECGMVKFDEEIVCMKMAAGINEAGYGAIVRDVRVGMTENDLRAIMAKAIYERGGEYIEGWVTNAGDRSTPRSFNWSDRQLRPRDFVTVEACHVNWCGYKVCYDRTFLVGAKPSELQREIYQTGVEMHERFQQLLKPGVTTRELAEKRPKPGINLKTPEQIREWRATWSNHFGGMGIAWDSAPYYYVPEDPDFVLERNMTMAYHAMMWVDGDAGGIAIENTYRITDTGCEMLTRWPYEDITIIGL
jgi:Xaa-Pro aminopeptidase